MPLMQRYGLSATARASFALYNGPDDVAQLADGLQKVRALFG
jgi:cysteine desulfurase / selenocysteine lyase